MASPTDPSDDGDQDDIHYKFEGPVPEAVRRPKPANSTMSRTSPEASMFDGPFGGKRPQ